jgi:hypothetical protein
MTSLSFEWDKRKNQKKRRGFCHQNYFCSKSNSKRVSTISRLVFMKLEYDLANMKSRPNPFAEQLNQQVTLPLRIDVINFFEKKQKKKAFLIRN